MAKVEDMRAMPRALSFIASLRPQLSLESVLFRSTSANIQVARENALVVFDLTGANLNGSYTVTLPAAALVNQVHAVKSVLPANGNKVATFTVSAADGATIDGLSSFIFGTRNQSVVFLWDGTQWRMH